VVSEFLALDDSAALDAAEAALRAGQPIVVPTDTVYGLAALPSSTEILVSLKGRPESMPIAVLVASLDQATSVASMSGAADRLARRFWPGPLTIVMDRRGGDGTVGVRWPDHDFIRALARRVGPLAVTSANRHGEPTPATAREAAAALIGDVALVVDGGRCDGLASTVVDATGSGIAILRAGPIAEELIRATALR
jgi:tRNA threonylcarbamoyl adenosine modification protein (Sua5/YciO/YrdC/YwlC family)